MGVIDVSDDNFVSELEQNDKVIVKYYADWCGSCKLFHPKFKRLSNDERFGGVRFLNINAENNADARKMAGIANLPSFAIFKNGQLVETVATSKEETVIDLIAKLN